MKQKIDWLNHGLEFIVVIIGILLAFQLNTCADQRKMDELVDQHINFISAESKENIIALDGGIEHSKKQLATARKLLGIISGTKDINTIRSLSTTLLDMRNVKLAENAYNVLATSGDIRHIKNYKDKKSVITMYESFEEVNLANKNLRNLYDEHFYPYLKKHFDLVNWSEIKPNSPETARAYYSPEYGNIISTYSYILEAKIRVYEQQKKIIESYLD